MSISQLSLAKWHYKKGASVGRMLIKFYFSRPSRRGDVHRFFIGLHTIFSPGDTTIIVLIKLYLFRQSGTCKFVSGDGFSPEMDNFRRCDEKQYKFTIIPSTFLIGNSPASFLTGSLDHSTEHQRFPQYSTKHVRYRYRQYLFRPRISKYLSNRIFYHHRSNQHDFL